MAKGGTMAILKKLVNVGVVAAIVGAASVGFAMKSNDFEGKPGFKPGSVDAAFVWHDAAGYHVRFTTKIGHQARHLYGTVCVGKDKMKTVKPALLEGKEYAKIGPKGHCVWYDFVTFMHIDGFDFQTDAKVVTFDLRHGKRKDKKRVPPTHIFLGKNKKHPAASPFIRTP